MNRRRFLSSALAPLALNGASRVEALLARMTLEEKVGQMNMPCVYVRELGRTPEARRDACRKFTEGTLAKGIGPGGGFFTLADNALPEGPRQQAEFFNELQKIALEKTRLKIPLLQSEEGTHGLMCSGGTIFPEGPALGSTWNPQLLERIYSAVAEEARAVGIHQLFTLVVEPTRDPRLGRNEEGYSEDPYLCGRIAEAIVTGIQGNDVSRPDKAVAGLCHYPGQGEPASGLERGAMAYSERMVREVLLPPWIEGIRKKGALGVMATYPAIDGIPTHASEFLLTKILRDELGFEGLVLSEGGGIGTLVYERIAANQKEAGQKAIRAGVDVGISYEEGYMHQLVESVKEGKVPMALIDRAVRRILALKFRLGLFDRPYVDVERAANGIDRQAHSAIALEAAREGIVLLKNENNLLPLAKDLDTIALIGPNAADGSNQLGDYVTHNILQKIPSILDGVKAIVSPRTQVLHVKGCDVIGTRTNEIEAARDAAKKARVAIVVVGENRLGEFNGPNATNGEGRDVASLDLTGMQEELIHAVHSTGTTTVVVLVNGRALSTRWVAERAPAVVEAWLPGQEGGRAVAEVLFGDVNPSGRLPVSIPRHSGQLPVYYNYHPSKSTRMSRGYVDMSATPLYEFGFGLSYTRFEYSNLRVTPDKIAAAGNVRVELEVRNAGSRAGAEVVQLYVTDPVASVSRPVQELRGFQKVALAAGESRKVEFMLGPEELAMFDRNMKRVVEPGAFEIGVGASSKNVRLKGKFLLG